MSENPKPGVNKLTRRQRKAKQLKIRRGIAIALAAAAAALAVAAVRRMPSLNTWLWLLAVVVLMAEVLVLSRRHRASVVLYALIGAAALGLIVAGPFFRDYMPADGTFVPADALVTELTVIDEYPEHFAQMNRLRTLNMRGSTVTDFSPIARKKSLRSLDIRDNHAFTAADCDALSAALPECDILWSVPMAGTWFDSDVTEIDLTGYDLEPDEIRELLEAWPDRNITYAVWIKGTAFSPSATALDLRNKGKISAEEISPRLTLLPNVRTIDMTGSPADRETVAALSEAWPDIRFTFTFDLPVEANSQDKVVTLGATDYDTLRACLGYVEYMPELMYIDAREVPLTREQVEELREDPDYAKVIYSLQIFGRKIGSTDSVINLDGVKMSDTAELESYLPYLSGLTRVEMNDCGLTDEQMGALCEKYPDIKFVWTITFGHYTLKTDATVFTTGLGDGNKFGYTTATFAPLKYCTDMLFLDLGHNKITDISGLIHMKKLRILILADNKIRDISILSQLKDLEYIELFLNDIKDFSPLKDLEKLVDLNIFYNPVKSVEPLCACTHLKRLWCGGCRFSAGDLARLKEALPDCRIVSTGRGSTGNGWRNGYEYYAIKMMYDTGVYMPLHP